MDDRRDFHVKWAIVIFGLILTIGGAVVVAWVLDAYVPAGPWWMGLSLMFALFALSIWLVIIRIIKPASAQTKPKSR